MKPQFVLILLVLAGLIILAPTHALEMQSGDVAVSGATSRVSVASDGAQGNGVSRHPAISANGRYVAFGSWASNLVPGDTNDILDAFVHDRMTGQTTRVSIATDGTQGNGYAGLPSISADGRYVAFESEAGNLVSGDTNFDWDIFVHDTHTGETIRVSVASDGTEGNGLSRAPSISANGQYVAFVSGASNLVSDDNNGYWDIFVHDRVSGETSRVSIATDGTQGDDHSGVCQGGGIPLPNRSVSLSADGRWVAFQSDASTLINEDANQAGDVFVHDRMTGETTRVSIASNGAEAEVGSCSASISAGGWHVTFVSDGLVSDDTNGVVDVYVRDRQTGATTRASIASDGTQGNGSSRSPRLSADGRHVAFWSYASNLVDGDTNGDADVFVHDRVTGETTRVSIASDGAQGNSYSQYAAITAEGRFVAFDSHASTLVPEDTNATWDVFMHDRWAASAAYSISGRVTDAEGDPLAGATLATASGVTTTDASGVYTFTNLVPGIYQVVPSQAGYSFSPATLSVSLPPNAGHLDFMAVADGGPPPRFLALPFDSPLSGPEALLNWHQGGRVNSWFDHHLPTYAVEDRLHIYTGRLFDADDQPHWHGKIRCFGPAPERHCYDGHDGYDLIYADPHPETPEPEALDVLTSAAGVVEVVKSDCVEGLPACGHLRGNHVIVDHGNGIFTLYGHLDEVFVLPGMDVVSGQALGTMGNTGNSGGTHLHFSVHRDDGDGEWHWLNNTPEDPPLDPSGWRGQLPEPWVAAGGPASHLLWLFDVSSLVGFSGSTGASFSEPTGSIAVEIPAGYFDGQVTLELAQLPPVAAAPEPRRTIGPSFSLQVVEAVGGYQGPGDGPLAPSSSLPSTQPITLTVAYTGAQVMHMDESQIELYHWDRGSATWQSLSATVNAAAHLVIAQTPDLGDFDLQAPLICPSDLSEPDDLFDAAAEMPTVGVSIARRLDVAIDEDWFAIEAVAGREYALGTHSLAPGVDTVLEIYARDGLTRLAADDNRGPGLASALEWQAPHSGTYFVRVAGAPGSAVGCGAAYELSVTQTSFGVYLPLVR